MEATIAQVGLTIRRGETTAQAVCEACLETVRSKDGALNAMTSVIDELALDAARKLDVELQSGLDRGPMHGVPIVLKDLIDVEGFTTTYGSAPAMHSEVQQTATLVQRLEQAGAVILGKTNLLEFAYGVAHPMVGQTNNPWDVRRTAGGSSGGSAAAVAAGMAFAAIGTDTGGSIRIPAAYCGVVGLKPTFGLVPLRGVFPLSWSLDHAGPIARSCACALTCLDAMTGATAIGNQPAAPALHQLRLGVVRNHVSAPWLEPEVEQAFENACSLLADAGAEMIDLTIPGYSEAPATLIDIVLPEAAVVHERIYEEHRDAYATMTRQQIESGHQVHAVTYLAAQSRRDELRRAMDVALTHVDALLSPSAPWVAPIKDPSVDGDEGHAEMAFTAPSNLTGHPSVSLLSAFTDEGLPAGLLITGTHGNDRSLLALGTAIEEILTPNT